MIDFMVGYFKIFTGWIMVSIVVLFILVLSLYYLQRDELVINRVTIENFFAKEQQCLSQSPTDADLKNFTRLVGNEFDQMDIKLGYMENIFEKLVANLKHLNTKDLICYSYMLQEMFLRM